MSGVASGTASIRRKLAENLRKVRERIAEACLRAGRRPESVSLVAVTKSVNPEVIRVLIDLGHLDLGENRVQQLVQRASLINEQMQRRLAAGEEVPGPVRWHMVGHLQRNKVKTVLPHVQLIHSVDTLRLAEEISNRAQRMNVTANVLMQVNVSGEKSKFGVALPAAPYLLEQIVTLPNLKVLGLMAMAPLVEEAEQARPFFVRLRELFEEVVSQKIAGAEFRHLSMGMSNDFEVAVEEGATIVRIGRALFEGLPVCDSGTA